MHPSFYLVVGLGKTGHSIARYLQRRNLPFVMFDTRLTPAGLAPFHAEFPDVEVFTNTLPSERLKQFTCIVTSPGVSLDEPIIQEAKALGIPVWGDVECFAREVQVPVIAITGTNGKSTVTSLVGEMAKSAGLSVAVGGNIGTPVLDLLDDGVHYDLWVLELSSFQLDLIESLAPAAATILNITPDHLDRHHDFEAYVRAKHRIYNCAKAIVYNREDEFTRPHASMLTQEVRLFSVGLDSSSSDWGIIKGDFDAYLTFGDKRILPVNALKIQGQHNWFNALVACALANAVGIDMTSMRNVLTCFGGLPHRSQLIRSIDGVDWINDSKGTNVGATVSAIAGIGTHTKGKIVLIAGGQGKGADFNELSVPVSHHVRSVVLIGEDADQIEQALMHVVPVLRASSMEEAVMVARHQAEQGDVVLLSPSCASFDMFRDFNHRGEVFTSLVNAL